MVHFAMIRFDGASGACQGWLQRYEKSFVAAGLAPKGRQHYFKNTCVLSAYCQDVGTSHSFKM